MILYFWWPFDDITAAKFFRKLTLYIKGKDIRVILAFLEFACPSIENSTVFRQIDTFLTTDISFKEGNFFQAKIFSSD
jgi:hypothetical protein